MGVEYYDSTKIGKIKASEIVVGFAFHSSFNVLNQRMCARIDMADPGKNVIASDASSAKILPPLPGNSEPSKRYQAFALTMVPMQLVVAAAATRKRLLG